MLCRRACVVFKDLAFLQPVRKCVVHGRAGGACLSQPPRKLSAALLRRTRIAELDPPSPPNPPNPPKTIQSARPLKSPAAIPADSRDLGITESCNYSPTSTRNVKDWDPPTLPTLPTLPTHPRHRPPRPSQPGRPRQEGTHPTHREPHPPSPPPNCPPEQVSKPPPAALAFICIMVFHFLPSGYSSRGRPGPNFLS